MTDVTDVTEVKVVTAVSDVTEVTASGDVAGVRGLGSLVTACRRLLWAVGAPARYLLVGLIGVYRVALGGWLGGQCRFYPSCSSYGEEAVRVHGAVRGGVLTAWRIARCGPFTAGGVDHVPPGRAAWRNAHSRRIEASR